MFAVLAGDSCSGKTRALYEALHDLVPHWPLMAPADASELADLLGRGQFGAGNVLWLNETQRHLSGTTGEQAAALLKEALTATNGAIAVGAQWERPYLAALTSTGNNPDTNAHAGALLLDCPRTRRIPKPFMWTKTVDEILETLAAYCERINDSGH